jgi:hypothetical protein
VILSDIVHLFIESISRSTAPINVIPVGLVS